MLTGKGPAFAAGLRLASAQGMHIINLELGQDEAGGQPPALGTGRCSVFQEHHARDGRQHDAENELPLAVRCGHVGGLSLVTGHRRVLLPPCAAGGVRRAGSQWNGGVAWWKALDRDGQQLLGPAHLWPGGHNPGQAPRAHPLPDQTHAPRDCPQCAERSKRGREVRNMDCSRLAPTSSL